MKFRHLCEIFLDTKNNKELVTLGMSKNENMEQNEKQKKGKNGIKKEGVRREYNIETYTSPKRVVKKKKKQKKKIEKQKSNHKTRQIRVHSESISFIKPKKTLNKNRKYESAGYSRVQISEEETSLSTRDEELGILIPESVAKENKFEYPQGI